MKRTRKILSMLIALIITIPFLHVLIHAEENETSTPVPIDLADFSSEKSPYYEYSENKLILKNYYYDITNSNNDGSNITIENLSGGIIQSIPENLNASIYSNTALPESFKGTAYYPLTVIDGTKNSDNNYVLVGSEVTIHTTIEDFDHWKATSGRIFTDSTAAETTITMPASPVTITAVAKQYYAVTIVESEHGQISIDSGNNTFEPGAAVNLNINPEENYELTEYRVSPADLEISDFSFKMPAENVTIQGFFNLKRADYTALNDAIEKAEAYDAALYQNYDAVTTAIQNVDYSLKIYDQETVDGYTDAILDALENLTYKDADYTDVEKAIEKAETYDAALYQNYDAVTAAIQNMNYSLKINEQETVDGYTDAILDALENLTYKDADYTYVDEVLGKVKQLKKEDYTNFNVVEEAVNQIVRDKDITQQAIVNQWAADINAAIRKLEKKPAPKSEPKQEAPAEKWDPNFNRSLNKGSVWTTADGSTMTSLGDGRYYNQNGKVFDGEGKTVGQMDLETGIIQPVTTPKPQPASQPSRTTQPITRRPVSNPQVTPTPSPTPSAEPEVKQTPTPAPTVTPMPQETEKAVETAQSPETSASKFTPILLGSCIAIVLVIIILISYMLRHRQEF